MQRRTTSNNNTSELIVAVIGQIAPPGLSKSSFLHALALEGGVFTTMRTTFNGTRILSLDRHVKRLGAAYEDMNDVSVFLGRPGRGAVFECMRS